MYTTDVLVKIGERIKTLSLAKNMTQNNPAIECKFEKASLSRIEAGKTLQKLGGNTIAVNSILLLFQLDIFQFSF